MRKKKLILAIMLFGIFLCIVGLICLVFLTICVWNSYDKFETFMAASFINFLFCCVSLILWLIFSSIVIHYKGVNYPLLKEGASRGTSSQAI